MPKKEKEKEIGCRLSYKYRIYPTQEQIAVLNQTIGCCRFVFNHYLTARKEAYERTQQTLKRPKISPKSPPDAEKPIYLRDKNGKKIYEDYVNEGYDPDAKSMSFFDTSKDLTRFKKEVVNDEGEAWLKNADATALIYALRHLEAAYQNFFRGIKHGEYVGYPRYKSKKNEVQSYTTAGLKLIYVNEEGNETAIDDFSAIAEDTNPKNFKFCYLPKVGKVKIKVHRLPQGKFVAATISRNNANQWFVSLNVKEVELKQKPRTAHNHEIGITYGISDWITTSDGEKVNLPEQMKQLNKKYIRAQRKLSRMEHGSANYEKQRVKAAKISAQIANIRSDATNCFTSDMVANYDLIASRQMKTQEMAKHKNKATRNLPKKVQQDINKKLSNGNFFEINRQLTYKAQWANRAFALVPADTPTAQVCIACGHKQVELAENLKAEWTCKECGAVHSRKYNGAVNVLEAGKDILADEEKAFVTKARKETKKKLKNP